MKYVALLVATHAFRSRTWIDVKTASCAAMLVLLGCTPPHERPTGPPRHTETDAAAISATPVASVTPVSVEPAPPPACNSTHLQSGVCVPPLGDLQDDAIKAWFAKRGVTVDPSKYEACEDVRLGPDHVLACTSTEPVVIDHSLGIAGPIERRREVELLTTRGTQPVELVRVPLALGDINLGEVLFSARYSVGDGAFDLEAKPDECAAARVNLGPYWDAEIATLRANTAIEAAFLTQLVRATRLERTSDAAWITATCRAAGHYVLSGDRLVKAP